MSGWGDWRPLSELGDVGFADQLVADGIPEDDVVVQMLRERALPPGLEPLSDALKRELNARGWLEHGTTGRRAARAWKHVDGEKAVSLTDAIVRQLMREAKS